MTRKILCLILASTFLLSCIEQENVESRIDVIDTHNFLTGFPVFTSDSLVNIVVEIPAGCNQKWEVDKETGFLEWERINDDSLRVVRYLSYPANYGMIPRTWLPIDEGGDDDPLDVFLLGQAVERGSVVPAKIIGVIKMLDKGLQDDKLIAVPVIGLFSEISTLRQLHKEYPGVIEILKIWLSSYKGEVPVEIIGIQDQMDAIAILKKASKVYEMRVSE